MRLLAALYVAAVLTWVGCALIRADKYVWKGIIYGLLFALGSLGLQIIGVVATLVGGAFFLGCALVALRRRQWSTAAFYGYVGMLGIGFGVCFGGLL